MLTPEMVNCFPVGAIPLRSPLWVPHIAKSFKFPDFRGALKFVNRIGELAEEQGHHPDIFLAWGKVEITTWTHKINGLTESDFILASKIDQLYKP
jgi:4a-hydroxytetrahydrobiopterin dehydratase